MPAVFSPSQLAHGEHCLLRTVMGSSGDVPALTAHPAAALGSVLHRVLELAVRGGIPRTGTPAEDALLTLERLIDEEEERLKTTWPQSPPSLRELLAPLKWRQKRRVVLDLVEKYLSGAIPQSLSNRRGPARDAGQLPPNTTWAEVQLDTPTLRLRGRVDLIQRRSDDIAIRDLKTGRVLTRDGEIIPKLERQMRLYGLMAHVVWPSARLSLIIDHGSERTVEFTDEHEAGLLESLKDVLDRLPADSLVQAATLATPGQACEGCAHRHVCPTYRRIAPDFWTGEKPARMPLDTWGVTTEVLRRADNLLDVSIKDAAHRAVKVFGLSAFRLAGLKPGDKVWLFGLHSTDKRGGPDLWRHPRNFFEVADDDPFSRAWALQAYSSE